MAANQLPENMGKKIVEALKKQALYEDEGYEPEPEISEEEISEPNISSTSFTEPAEDTLIEEEPQISMFDFNKQSDMPLPVPSVAPSSIYSSPLTAELPTNVAVLNKLIAQLPAGISKQVGALVIRQTIEALGISMHSVLQEAQQVQETLNSAVKECSLKIQDCRNQIMQLEKNAQDYQRQMSQINDLISLFILTDNKRSGL